jgi:hypothetical protein
MTNGSLGVNADHLLAGLGGFLLDGMVAQPCADALRQADDLARAAPELLAEGKLGERIEKCPALDTGALRGRELSDGGKGSAAAGGSTDNCKTARGIGRANRRTADLQLCRLRLAKLDPQDGE